MTRQAVIAKAGKTLGTLDVVASRERIRLRLRNYILVSLSLTLLLLIACSLTPLALTRRYILAPLAALAEGKLGQPTLTVPSNWRCDEIGELRRVFNNMRQRLQSLLEHLDRAGTLLQSSSEEILMAVSQLAAAL